MAPPPSPGSDEAAGPSAPAQGAPASMDPALTRYLQQVEAQAVRDALPRGLQDDKAKELKYQLHWCLSKNDWYFTGAGILLGGAFSWMAGSIKPFAVAVLLAPAADWAYGRHVCAEEEQAYREYKRHLVEQYRKQAQELKEQIRSMRTS